MLILAAGGSASAALAVASWGAGSMVGLAVGRLDRISLPGHGRGTAILPVAMGLLQLATQVHQLPALGLAAAAFVAGLPISAVLAGLFAQLGDACRGQPQSEFFAWATTVIFAGDATHRPSSSRRAIPGLLDLGAGWGGRVRRRI